MKMKKSKEKEEILTKARKHAKKKAKALHSNKLVKKTVMPNGNIHFDKEL